MRKIIYNLTLVVSVLICFNSSQIKAITNDSKKAHIILYEDGTWEKVPEIKNDIDNDDIETTWKLFQDAVKISDTNKVLEFFDYPFDIDVCSNDESKIYKSIGSSYSKKKLLSNYKILFDNKFVNAIVKSNADEYSKGSKYNSYFLEFTKSRNSELVYEIQFYKIKNKYKIGVILIGYGK